MLFDGENIYDVVVEDGDNGIRYCDNENYREKCFSRYCLENLEKFIFKSGLVSSLNSEVEKYCSVL